MSITAVPLRPVKSSSLWTLWIGLALLVALAIGGAFWTAQAYQGVSVETIKPGTGPSPTAEDVVLVNYKGMLADGTEFDSGKQTPFDLQQMIPGFAKGLTQMQAGGKYRLTIPAKLGYGADEKRNPKTGEVVIPGNSDLVFDVDLLEFKTRAEIEALQQQMQMMQQQMQQQGGAPGAPGAAGPPQPGQ
ncbi:FKBP-type peptidyl-prolyl cis-trans isomerase [Sphingorhabdus soli]|uniref:Peptidyl-prolyl cis-trans isomerase n=1 Tax=Flavisphingopyxis soli TaxID=2601267 RepID=A0A5C6USN6_9SPHN|nr:FKBP-type peptidyl-prolyl cis-trans isomerase [Sphingorhabdus soli]TXC73888.1 FKBP-type peptidyl-prolyl cis-trans isomerase [Sphingorhabdus soli]